jgi:cysteine-rich repeat protein
MSYCERPATCGDGETTFYIHDEDFEADDGGYTHTAVPITADEWQRGLPTFAPITTCNSGTNCWKTDLDNTYTGTGAAGPDNTQDLLSPAIDLSDVVGPVYLRYARKYAIEEAHYDEAFIGIGPVGGPHDVLWSWNDSFVSSYTFGSSIFQLAGGWGTDEFDISSFAGETVELRFRLEADPFTEYAGLAIDDVQVWTCTECGNLLTEPGETCDDGNDVDDDGCDSNCTLTGCGNGIVTAGEDCDDGNLTDDDGCDSNCTDTACGNAITTTGEECDDGNDVEGDGCDTNCTTSACGNEITAGTEECDDGNVMDGDGCDSNCTMTGCGNMIVTDGEGCDDGNDVEGDGCDSNCTVTGCGNAIVTEGEECDDGNTLGDDGCDALCAVEPFCGDATTDVADGETCDDGNNVDGDGCDSACQLEPEDGCGCTAGRAPAGDSRFALLLLLGAAFAIFRRRRR